MSFGRAILGRRSLAATPQTIRIKLFGVCVKKQKKPQAFACANVRALGGDLAAEGSAPERL